jgi:hypothetical protein
MPMTIASDPGLPLCPGKRANFTVSDAPDRAMILWSITHGADCYAKLVDGVGQPKFSGDNVYALAMPHDLQKGGSFELKAVVNWIDKSRKAHSELLTLKVTVHKVKFTHDVPFQEIAYALPHKTATRLMLGGGLEENRNRFRARAQIIITIPADCKNAHCYREFKVGWVQAIVRNHRVSRYQNCEIHTRLPRQDTAKDNTAEDNVNPPVRDCAENSVFFTDDEKVVAFPSKSGSVYAELSDSPGTSATWVDPRGGNLESLTLDNRFIAWLVVQHAGWASKDPLQAATFLCHVRWRIQFEVRVLDAGARTLEGEELLAGQVDHEIVTVGKGEKTPTTTGQGANDVATTVNILW